MEKLTPRRIHTAINSLRGQMLFTNSFTSDNNLEPEQLLVLNELTHTNHDSEKGIITQWNARTKRLKWLCPQAQWRT